MVKSLKWTRFTLLTALHPLVRGLEKRGSNATTDVVCQTSFSWMNNGNNQSPCLVAAILSEACATAGGWNVPVLNGGSYSFPNSSTANACVCSWAVYNLLGACTVCQNNTNVDNWSPYKAGCGSFTLDTYWSPNYTVPNNTLLPYWAATDPSKWTGSGFNSDDALTIHSQGNSDINLSTLSQPSPPPTDNAGAIAGGTVGGLVAVAGSVALVFYLRCRKRNKVALPDPLLNATSHTIHGRSLPDFRPTASLPNMYTFNGPIAPLHMSHTASHSMHSLPYDLSIIGLASTSSLPAPPPSQPAMLSPQASNSGGHPQILENVILPYTLTSPSQDLSSTDRKCVDGSLFPIIAQQNESQSGPSNNQPARRRMNPPTYTQSATSGESSVIGSLTPSRSVDIRERGHGHQGSSDTTDSSLMDRHGNGTESSWSPIPRRTQMVHESALSRFSALSGFSGIAGMGSDLGPSSVIRVGSAAISSPTDSRTNLMSVAGSVIGGDDIA